MPLVQTRGAASAQGFGEFAQTGAVNYIEDVFNIGLYSASGGSETFSILGSVDMYTKGGLMWIKSRNFGSSHSLIRPTLPSGGGLFCQSNTVAGQNNFTLSEFRVNSNNTVTMANGSINDAGYTYASWTFRKQPKFFDVVTYTGTGSNRTIAHSLGSVPGSIIIKRTDTIANWAVYHRSLANTQYLVLNANDKAATGATWWNSTTPTSAVFSLGTDASVNASGGTYVAYIFAHDAGGFGLSGTDNVISCGSYTGNGSANGPEINLGYEPQFVIIKQAATNDNDWEMYDNMRGVATGGNDARLIPNSSAAEETTSDILSFTATGFKITNAFSNTNGSGETYIYIAIRRGPMKVPTLGTSVFNSVARTGNRLAGSLTGIGFNPDSLISLVKTGSYQHEWNNKLVGSKQLLRTTTNESEFTSTDLKSYDQDGISFNATDFNSIVNIISPLIQYFLKRAPSFFDIVCYTGVNPNGDVNLTINHNLGVPPEIIIIKRRSSATSNNNWYCGWNMNSSTYMEAILNTSDAGTLYNYPNWFTSAPTASTFEISYQGGNVNQNGATYVAYLFATCAGVSKVGSYTGTGALQTINCGFTSGARFVLIKRTDSTGSWWLYDSTRGISSSDDPYLFLNSNGAEVTNTNYVDTDTTGFKVTAAAPANLNASGGTYIFLAIA